MTIDRSIEEPCEVTSLMHGSGAERRGRPLRLGNKPMQENNGRGGGIAQAPIEGLERISTSSLGIPSKRLASRLPGVSTINHRTIPFFLEKSWYMT